MFRIAVAALMSAIAAGTATADETTGPYTDTVAVHVETTRPEHFKRVTALGASLLSCHEHLGGTDYLIGTDQLAALEALGIPFNIIVEDVQAAVDAHAQAVAAAEVAGGATFYSNFRDRPTIEARLNQLVNNNPGIAEIIDIGDSVEGRDLWMVRITGNIGQPANKPGILFNGCQHAREWVSPMTVTYIVEQMLNSYGSDPRVTSLVDDNEFYIIPIVNPDGYQYSWDFQRLWRKNRRNNGNGTTGVDLNRNWGVNWGGPGSSSDPSNETFHGTGPFSEPETTAMRDFYLAHPNIVASIDFHSFGQLALYPWGYQLGGPDDGGVHEVVGDEMVSAIASISGQTYTPGPVMDTLYQASGGSLDWTYGERDAISFTIELRDTGQGGFLLPPDQIIPTCEENWEAVLRFAELTTRGALISFPEGRPGFITSSDNTTMPVQVVPVITGSVNESTARLVTRVNGGAWTETPMTNLGGALFEATFPTAPCDSTVDYYIAIDASDGNSTYVSPDDAPTDSYSTEAFDISVIASDDFEADQGWTVTNIDVADGAWERGVPAGLGDRGDPLVDADGSGACYLTDNVAGNSDLDGGPTILTSPVYDLAGAVDAYLEYSLWFTNDDLDEDAISVELSANSGASWQLVETTGTLNGWVDRLVRVNDFITPSATVQVRFSAVDNPNNSVTEAGVDGIRFFERACAGPIPGDADGDGDVDFNDVIALLAAWGPCGDPCPIDFDGSGAVDFGDLLITLSSWTG